MHINLLELKALFLGLQAFREDVIGHHVTVMCDNSTVVRLLRWTESFDVHLDARYLPGQNNILTDVLSRRGQVVGTEWALHPHSAV